MSPEKLARFADSWKYFVCPLCREELRLEGTSLHCERGHTYDVARQGYVNLAPGARQSEYYSRESFENRGRILGAGQDLLDVSQVTAVRVGDVEIPLE